MVEYRLKNEGDSAPTLSPSESSYEYDRNHLRYYTLFYGKSQASGADGLGNFYLRRCSMTATTGQTCPISGVWQVVGVPTTTAPIAKGNRMPPYDGKAVTWQLIRCA